MSTKSGIKKTFSWRFGPSKFGRKSKNEADIDEADARRPTFSFNQQASSGAALPSDADPAEGANKSSIGLISDILDGVVFAPVGTSEAPQLSPHTRSRSTLLSFRPAPAEEAAAAVQSKPANPGADGATPPSKTSCDLVRASSVKSPLSHLPPRLETLFQQELAAKVKKRSLVVQQQTLKESGESAAEKHRSEADSKQIAPTPEFDNPLYQSLHDCLSGAIPPAPPLPPDAHHYDEPSDDATYADIDDAGTYHYKTVKTAGLRKFRANDTIYAQVGERPIKASLNAAGVAATEPEAIYENVEELHEEQTYANIRPVADNSNGTGQVLTALVLDVDTAASRTRDLSSSSGGSSASPPDSSPEQLSPADSLANDSVDSTRSAGTPDSGVFGLLRPVDSDKPSQEKIELLSKTLKQFERLEELSSEIVVPKVKVEKSVSFALDTIQMTESTIQLESEMSSLEQLDIESKGSDRVNEESADKEDEEGSFEAVAVESSERNENGDGDAWKERRSRLTSPEPHNLGARIFEDATKKRERLERSRNEKLGLVDAGESLERLSQKRYDVIEQMTPRKPKKIEWLPAPLADADSHDSEHHLRQTGNTSRALESNDKRSSDLATMQLEEAPFAVNEPRAEPAQAISPPPGFETMQSAQVAEPLLGNDDFVDVASITFKGEDERDEGRAFVQFDDDDDDGGDFIAGQKLDRNPAPGSHPLPALYFEPDHSSREESDDELEASSSVASFSMKEQPVNSHHNPTETLIEREIRLQREREEAVLRERQRALELVEAARKHSKTCETAPTSNHEDAGADKRHAGDVESSRKTVVETKRPPSVESNSAVSPAEIRISEEIRDLKRREEELRALREAHAHVRLQHSGSAVEHSSSLIASAATEDEGLYSDAERDACSEHNSSRVESPEAGIVPSEYSKFPHQRTQSMDSMSSGHSSGDHAVFANQAPIHDQSKRGRQAKAVVMPMENPSDDDVPIYRRMSKETPIEREIRLAREREEALRREKGFQCTSSSANQTRKTSNEKRSAYRSGSSIPENRNVQHRYATSVIQREIDEIAERENELLRDGKIQTTSVERGDSKGPAVGDFPKVLDTKRTLAKSASVPAKSYDAPRNGSQRDEGDERPASKCATLQSSKSISAMKDTPSRQFGTMSSLLPNQTGRRNFSHVQGGQRGIMEKFLLSRGRLSQPATFNSPSPVGPAPLIPAQSSAITPGSSAGDPVGVMHPTGKASLASVRHAPTVVRPIEIQAFKHDEDAAKDAAAPVRRHYATTEEKIQQEFREMQQREEELRLTRSKLLAKSQPNLLDIDDAPAGADGRSGTLRAAHSISDLLADDIQNGDAKQNESKVYSTPSTVKGARRKSALIAQWESRIHQQDF